ncbi:MarR family winged helix-turn-helix transcriptional regulator [Brooklawnia cerclae]|uniref:DNA-binding MarR family transcriptional regulator n=1 Tax=Brooklawnia cerclae TaxID=349934 RepID=A0ABX0SIM1_9ACTN|nr:MarR family transcriptional regulator [Brooklawnia cerclae]NIH56587.1 DNA-binding MarR family transcriptional regulator [Brooklawnia cerclae]
MDLFDIKTLNTAIEALLNRRLASVSLTYTQGTVLELLVRSGEREIVQKDLEERLGLSHPTVNGVLNRLSSKGLVVFETSEKDRRRKRVHLTEQGRGLAAYVSIVVDKMCNELFEGFSADEVEELAALVRRTIESVRRAGSDR